MNKKLWGSRFSKKTNPSVEKFSASINFDFRLAKYDCLAGIAHAKMLGKQKIISQKEALLLVKGLQKILKSIKQGNFKIDPQAEDIHSQIQNELYKIIGKTAEKLHTARSRNDLVVTEVKMYLKEHIEEIIKLITKFQKEILNLAERNIDVVIPGYTHLQRAQYVLMAHHLLAYLESLERDKQRFLDTMKRLEYLPLGSAALAGTSLPIDRDYLKKELGFKNLTSNSIDAVSDRDFILETLADFSILVIHLSRISEDLILWFTSEFDFIDIDDAFCTGSSIMPHKKNPDVLELIRGSTGKILGNFFNVLILLKALPLSYNRDLQLDKPPLFDTIETIKEILQIFTLLFRNITVKKERIKEKLEDESLFSVDIVEYLIKKGLSYREAHDIVGRLIKDCLDNKKRIIDLTKKQLEHYSSKFAANIKDIINAKKSVELKSSYGSTNPKLVKNQLSKWIKKLS